MQKRTLVAGEENCWLLLVGREGRKEREGGRLATRKKGGGGVSSGVRLGRRKKNTINFAGAPPCLGIRENGIF